jgi:hypothetical protein
MPGWKDPQKTDRRQNRGGELSMRGTKIMNRTVMAVVTAVVMAVVMAEPWPALAATRTIQWGASSSMINYQDETFNRSRSVECIVTVMNLGAPRQDIVGIEFNV